MVSYQLGPFQTCLSASFDESTSFRPCYLKADKKTRATVLNHFPSLPLSGNTVIGGNQKKGGHALDDDKCLKRFIIPVPFSPSYEEDFLASHIVGCVFDPLLTHGEVVKWRL